MGVVARWSTWTEVANYALAQLGAGKIDNLSDGTAQAAVCTTHLPVAVSDVAESRDWRCLTSRVELAQNATPPLNDFDYSYQLPVDFLRLALLDKRFGPVESLDTAASSTPGREPVSSLYPYSIESGRLFTNGAYVYIRYIKQPGDALSEYPVSFLVAVGAQLALLISMPLTSDPRLTQNLLRELATAMRSAESADASRGEDTMGSHARGYSWYDEVR